MVVGTGKIKFRLFDSGSLKAKRSVVKSIIHRTRNKFNISIAETDYQDVHQWAEIGFTMAGSDGRQINSALDKVIRFIDNLGLAMIVDSQIEIIHF